MSEQRCPICEAYFHDSDMVPGPVGILKCKLCAEAHPKAKTKAEVLAKGRNKAETLTEARVKVLVYEILAEANIVRHECETCGKPFFRHATMQTVCSKCKVKKETEAKAKADADAKAKRETN